MPTQTKNIYQRIIAVMEEVDYIQKENKPGMRYSIVSHDAVTHAVRPILVKHGIVYHPIGITANQNGNRTEVILTIRFTNADEPTEFIDVPSLGYGIDDQDKGPGKAISYAVKYALLKTLGLETGDDPDNEQDVTHKPAPTKTLSAPQSSTSSPKEVHPDGDYEIRVTDIYRGMTKTNKPFLALNTPEGSVKVWEQFVPSFPDTGTYSVRIVDGVVTDVFDNVPM